MCPYNNNYEKGMHKGRDTGRDKGRDKTMRQKRAHPGLVNIYADKLICCNANGIINYGCMSRRLMVIF